MKKFVIFMFILVLNVSFSNAQETSKKYLIKVESENFRSSPSGNILGKLNAGTSINVIKEEGNWVKVQVEGYVWKPSITSDPTSITGFKFHAMHILLKNEADATQVLNKINSGGDFNELAVEFSTDPGAAKNKGDLGLFEKGDLVKDFENAVLKLKTGQVSSVVKTPLGYHIIKRVK